MKGMFLIVPSLDMMKLFTSVYYWPDLAGLMNIDLIYMLYEGMSASCRLI